jgi:hypothetical protein
MSIAPITQRTTRKRCEELSNLLTIRFGLYLTPKASKTKANGKSAKWPSLFQLDEHNYTLECRIHGPFNWEA